MNALDDRLRAEAGEPELLEFPRGLVGYAPRGERGRPAEPAEDRLANRIELVGRLLALSDRSEAERAATVGDLGRAAKALERGDREEALHLLDRAHRRVAGTAPAPP